MMAASVMVLELLLDQPTAANNKAGGYRTHIYIGPLPSLA